MKICQSHWDRIRAKLDELGIGHLGAKSGEAAIRNVVTELEGREAENDYDPLMACNNMIWSNGMRYLGLSLMAANADGSDRCPVCEIVRATEEEWINGPTQAALSDCRERGLVPPAEA